MPSVLIEMGFLSNRTEERYLASDEGQTILARSIYRAFSDYKYDYDRKQGNIASAGPTTLTPGTSYNGDDETLLDDNMSTNDNSGSSNGSGNGNSVSSSKDEIIYKIQILTSDKKIPENDKRFKGYDEISFYIEKGIYKYTYGSTSDYRKILNMLKKTSTDFKGAFIIKMKDGQRIY
jgi:N-acetylmuramoyl-L-alanine amidase